MNSEVRDLDLVVCKVWGNPCLQGVEVGRASSWSDLSPTVVEEGGDGRTIPIADIAYDMELNNDVLPEVDPDGGPEVADTKDVPIGGDHVPDGVETELPNVDVYGDNEYYEADRAVDSDDDRPVGELSQWEKDLLKKVITSHDPLVPYCRDLRQAYWAVADGEHEDYSVPAVESSDIIQRGLIFETMDALKLWLAEYAVVHH